MPTSAARAGTPSSSLSSEIYVGVDPSSTPELEVIDSTTGGVIGSPIPLAGSAAALSNYFVPRTRTNEVAVAEANDSFQVVNPETDSVSSGTSLGAAPNAVATTLIDTDEHYALVLVPSLDEVQIENLENLSAGVVQTVSLGFSSGSPAGLTVDGSDQNFAYVTDPTSHEIKTLEFDSSSTPFQVDSTYTGGSSFDPTSIVTDSAYSDILVSDGQNLDVSSLSAETYSAYSSQIAITCTSGVTAGALSINGTGAYVDVQESGSDYTGEVAMSSSSLSYCLNGSYAPGAPALSDDGGVLAIPSSSGSSLDLYSTQGSSIGSLENVVSLPATATAIVPATELTLDEEAYVAEYSANKVSLVNLTTDLLDQQVGTGSGSEPDAVAVSPDGQYAYVADYGTNKVSVIQSDLVDSTSGPLVATISLPSGSEPDALAVSPDGDQLAVADYGTGYVSIIDTNPNAGSSYLTVTGSVCTISACSSATQPDGLAFSPDGGYLYALDEGDDDLSVLTQSGGTYSLQTTLTSQFSNPPTAIAVSPNDRSLWVTIAPSSGYGTVEPFAIDPANGDPVSGTAVTVQNDPAALAISPNGGVVYVTNDGSNSLSVVNTCLYATGTCSPSVSSTVSVSSTASAVAVTPDGSEFVTTSASSTSPVSIYATGTSSPSSSVALGSTTGSLAVAVSPFYQDPAPTSLAGYENDVNPSVAESSSVDIEAGVDTASGSYTLNRDDLSLPDIGIGLDLSQEYDSANAATNTEGLGYGWSFSYGMSATQVSATGGSTACDVTIVQGNGTPVVFYPPSGWSGSSCPTSGYQPAGWEQASLSTVASCYSGDTCWDMTEDGTTQYLFDQPSGRLVYEKDLNGNTVTLAYNSSGLHTVTGESGVRQLTFTWSGGNISEVEDSAGRTATFGYTSGNLTSLTLLASSTGDTTTHEWALSYNSSHELTDWWSPNNEAAYSGNTAEATQIGYNSAGEVTSVTRPAWLDQCDGASGTPHCAPETTFSYASYDMAIETGSVEIADANENYDASASVNDGDGNVTLDHYADGVLLSQVNGYGYETSTTSPY